nr:dTDP-4-dehydrorhamnose reductase [Prochlorococcus marinus]
MKILITGSTGQLGIELLNQLERIKKKESLTIINPSKEDLDLTNSIKCEKYIEDINPDILINLAAFTAVDNAEIESESARQINALALRSFANVLKKNGGHIIQISTDYVFNGEENKPYQTFHKRNPLGVYGKTKSEGESFLEQILENTNQFTIIRTSWLVSPWRKNFVKTILKKLKEGKENESLKVVSDQIGCITTAKSLSNLIILIIERKIKNICLPSHLHWSSNGSASWYEIAVKIKEISNSINLFASRIDIKPIESFEYKSLCPRPKFSVLDTSLTTKTFGIKNDFWINDLEILLKEIKDINNSAKALN